jgi:hypothetical protein
VADSPGTRCGRRPGAVSGGRSVRLPGVAPLVSGLVAARLPVAYWSGAPSQATAARQRAGDRGRPARLTPT